MKRLVQSVPASGTVAVASKSSVPSSFSYSCCCSCSSCSAVSRKVTATVTVVASSFVAGSSSSSTSSITSAFSAPATPPLWRLSLALPPRCARTFSARTAGLSSSGSCSSIATDPLSPLLQKTFSFHRRRSRDSARHVCLLSSLALSSTYSQPPNSTFQSSYADTSSSSSSASDDVSVSDSGSQSIAASEDLSSASSSSSSSPPDASGAAASSPFLSSPPILSQYSPSDLAAAGVVFSTAETSLLSSLASKRAQFESDAEALQREVRQADENLARQHADAQARLQRQHLLLDRKEGTLLPPALAPPAVRRGPSASLGSYLEQADISHINGFGVGSFSPSIDAFAPTTLFFNAFNGINGHVNGSIINGASSTSSRIEHEMNMNGKINGAKGGLIMNTNHTKPVVTGESFVDNAPLPPLPRTAAQLVAALERHSAQQIACDADLERQYRHLFYSCFQQVLRLKREQEHQQRTGTGHSIPTVYLTMLLGKLEHVFRCFIRDSSPSLREYNTMMHSFVEFFCPLQATLLFQHMVERYLTWHRSREQDEGHAYSTQRQPLQEPSPQSLSESHQPTGSETSAASSDAFSPAPASSTDAGESPRLRPPSVQPRGVVTPSAATFHLMFTACNRFRDVDSALAAYDKMIEVRDIQTREADAWRRYQLEQDGINNKHTSTSAGTPSIRPTSATVPSVSIPYLPPIITPTKSTFHALIAVCAAAANIPAALSVLQRMAPAAVSPDLKTFNTVIATCGNAGDVKSAIKVYDQLKKAALVPDHHTYAALIHAYTTVGDVQALMLMLESLTKLATKPFEAPVASSPPPPPRFEPSPEWYSSTFDYVCNRLLDVTRAQQVLTWMRQVYVTQTEVSAYNYRMVASKLRSQELRARRQGHSNVDLQPANPTTEEELLTATTTAVSSSSSAAAASSSSWSSVSSSSPANLRFELSMLMGAAAQLDTLKYNQHSLNPGVQRNNNFRLVDPTHSTTTLIAESVRQQLGLLNPTRQLIGDASANHIGSILAVAGSGGARVDLHHESALRVWMAPTTAYVVPPLPPVTQPIAEPPHSQSQIQSQSDDSSDKLQRPTHRQERHKSHLRASKQEEEERTRRAERRNWLPSYLLAPSSPIITPALVGTKGADSSSAVISNNGDARLISLEPAQPGDGTAPAPPLTPASEVVTADDLVPASAAPPNGAPLTTPVRGDSRSAIRRNGSSSQSDRLSSIGSTLPRNASSSSTPSAGSTFNDDPNFTKYEHDPLPAHGVNLLVDGMHISRYLSLYGRDAKVTAALACAQVQQERTKQREEQQFARRTFVK